MVTVSIKNKTMKHKAVVIASFLVLAACLAFVQSNAQQVPPPKGAPQGGPKGNPMAEFEHPKNLKVLPKNISPEDLAKTMREFSMALGVRCGFCHAAKENKTGGRPEPDFASDAKPEKKTARTMYHMTSDINKKYISALGPDFEKIACVSCHRGSTKPMVSIDSLPKKSEMPKKTD